MIALLRNSKAARYSATGKQGNCPACQRLVGVPKATSSTTFTAS